MNYLNVYDNAFSVQEYNIPQRRTDEPRYNFVNDFVKKNKNDVKNIIDIGSGRGILLELLLNTHNDINIISCDINKYHNVQNVEFHKIDLSNKDTYLNICRQDLLTCLDVMEHLDKSFIEDVFLYFSQISKKSIISIANHSDILNNVELHTIQEDDSYWTPIIKKYFKIESITEEYIVKSKPTLYIYYLESLNCAI